ncbi:MAG TPA: FAD binding domain-containing protein [Bryobacterales bacterium]|jgi:xanthine dehydrogenase YagS FAD-binding subunit|nr:FAD binding domain-containing protein [Bryobacterales bacterium]
MQAFEYASPKTTKEALGLLGSQWGETDILAGGTDLLALMKDYIHTPRRVVSLGGIKELKTIKSSGDGLHIGAMVTFAELIENSTISKEYPTLNQAAHGVSSQQIRAMGTVGGDLCQRPRCWYFRNGFGLLGQDGKGNPLVPNGENRYHAILGNSGPAKFVSASSLGPPLISLGAKVVIASSSGNRTVDVAKFFVTPENANMREVDLKPNEILTEIIIPPHGGAKTATYEVRQKMALDWPLTTASVALKMSGSTVQSAVVVLGHVAPTPWNSPEAAQAITGKSVTDATAQAAADAALARATPLSKNAYKVQLAKVAVKRALLLAATGRA